MNHTKDGHLNQTENLLVNDNQNSCGEVGLSVLLSKNKKETRKS